MPSTPYAYTSVLDHLPTEESTDRDDAVEIVSRKFTPHRIDPQGERFRLTARTGDIDGVGLHHIGYGSPLTIEADPLRQRHLVCIPLWGKAVLEIGDRHWFCDPQTPMLLPPDREFRLHWLDDSPQFVVSIPNERIERVAAAMFGEPGAAIPLPPTFTLSSGAGRALAAELTLAHDDINSGAARSFPAFLSRNVAEGLVARILLGATESRRGGVYSRTAAQRPQTKLVTAFLERIASPECLESSPLQIAEQLGVPLRTLQENVQRELGVNLAEALRRNRLRAARSMLLDADPTRCSVTEVAMRCGFRHLGRFSVEYREAFGEKPSETLRLLA
ncbi:MAG: AraC family transcriptional regulator [Candidatus Leucobacter sulfamidivorax]|nr:AraC family transcriptional regulator [Candidatus Leucobacter sulfamidivorax]